MRLYSPCWNNGKCIPDNRQWSCECFDGFYGIDCKEKTDILCKISNPCQNGGICQSVGAFGKKKHNFHSISLFLIKEINI
jgi:hypothetical protein